jgi:hypothetical protein
MRPQREMLAVMIDPSAEEKLLKLLASDNDGR